LKVNDYSAEGVAIIRAMESLKPENERGCYDPLAVQFLSTKYRILIKFTFLAKIIFWLLVRRRLPCATDQVVARAPYYDEYLKECIDSGIKQLVILGAGYDTKAYRFNELKGRVKVFEVDLPTIQKVKIDRVKKIFGFLPDYVVYVPIDFNKEKLEKRLFESAYDGNLKTLFIWEGVTYYISAEAVDETLAFVSKNACEGSSIIFDYIFKSVVDGTCELEEAREWRQIHLGFGEALFGIAEGTIDKFLSDRGFCQIHNVTPELLQSTYFRRASKGRRVAPYMPTVHATVKPRQWNSLVPKGDMAGHLP
jgi:methyltransferase (TIGR00027 family)